MYGSTDTIPKALSTMKAPELTNDIVTCMPSGHSYVERTEDGESFNMASKAHFHAAQVQDRLLMLLMHATVAKPPTVL